MVSRIPPFFLPLIISCFGVDQWLTGWACLVYMTAEDEVPPVSSMTVDRARQEALEEEELLPAQ